MKLNRTVKRFWKGSTMKKNFNTHTMYLSVETTDLPWCGGVLKELGVEVYDKHDNRLGSFFSKTPMEEPEKVFFKFWSFLSKYVEVQEGTIKVIGHNIGFVTTVLDNWFSSQGYSDHIQPLFFQENDTMFLARFLNMGNDGPLSENVETQYPSARLLDVAWGMGIKWVEGENTTATKVRLIHDVYIAQIKHLRGDK